jgi:hypothetical protein
MPITTNMEISFMCDFPGCKEGEQSVNMCHLASFQLIREIGWRVCADQNVALCPNHKHEWDRMIQEKRKNANKRDDTL